MGSGKTSLGKKLSNKLCCDFIDLDREIEHSLHMEIPEIFKKEGEAFFRNKESEILRKTTKEQKDFVMACGGGTACFHNNIEFMNASGETIFLDVDEKILFGRLKKKKSHRPLITQLNDIELKAYIRNQLSHRREFYVKCKYKLKENNPTVKKVLGVMDYSG